jgi:uncharacterized membrane protein
MSFFLSSEITLAAKLLEVLYILMGIIAGYTGIKTLFEKDHKSRIPTCIFWTALAVVLAFGRWLPNIVSGILVVVMAAPAILRRVKPGTILPIAKEHTEKMANKIGYRIFIPTLAMGTFAIIFAVFTRISPLVGVGVGVIVAMIILMIFSRDNTCGVFFNDSKRLLDTVGPLSMLPMLLAALGAIFTAAGVGNVIANLLGRIIPEGNMTVGILVFALAMPLFTMIMGNAFAAITVITVGIGGPFVLSLGANPVVIGMLALTCGYCGTLLTPMAANFNIVPVAILDMKGRYNVIKNQVIVAILVLAFQIGYMFIAK